MPQPVDSCPRVTTSPAPTSATAIAATVIGPGARRSAPSARRRWPAASSRRYRRVLGLGVLEGEVAEEVEAGEADRPEGEEREEAALEAQRPAALDEPQDREEAERRDAVAQRGEVDGVDAAQDVRGDREHRAPREGRGERQQRGGDPGSLSSTCVEPSTGSTQID